MANEIHRSSTVRGTEGTVKRGEERVFWFRYVVEFSLF